MSRQNGTSAAPTFASAVFERLRADILEGRLAPGEKLRVERLCDRYQVGASPLREALNRLVSFHLVEQIEQRGFRVSPISENDLSEVVRTRCWVNEIVLREAVAHGDDAWDERIALAFHRLWKYPIDKNASGPDQQWELLHRQFHREVVSACPSRWLLEFHEALSDYADRHRHLASQKGYLRRDVMTEHRNIMEAATRRDAAGLIELLNGHYLLTYRLAAQAAAACGRDMVPFGPTSSDRPAAHAFAETSLQRDTVDGSDRITVGTILVSRGLRTMTDPQV